MTYKLLKAGIKTWETLNDEEFKLMINLQRKYPDMFEK